jgi:uncharacterized protein
MMVHVSAHPQSRRRALPRPLRTTCARRLLALLLVLSWAGLAPLATNAQQPIPPLTARVTDLTATLTAPQRAALEQKLAALESRKGAQLAVLLVPTTAGEAIEAYSLRVAEAWQIGRGKTDDGIVLVVAKDDRKLRIEVGYGLEGAVPDALAKRIIAERIVPRFYDDNYAGGVNDGVDALIGLIDGEALPPPANSPGGRDVDAFGALPFVFFFSMFVAPILRRIFGALPGALLIGAGAGFVAWVISSVLFLSAALGGVVFLLALAGVIGGPGRWSSGGGWGGGRGGFGGGFGRGGFGGGGGGGFRGGGGGFGGGGASGRW